MQIKVLQVTPQPDSVELVLVKMVSDDPKPHPSSLSTLRCAGYRFDVLEVLPNDGRTFGLRLKCDLIGLTRGMLLHDDDDEITDVEMVSALQRVMHLVRQIASINSVGVLARWAALGQSDSPKGEPNATIDLMLEGLSMREDFQTLMEACESFRKSMPSAARLRELDEAQRDANELVATSRSSTAFPPIGARKVSD